MAALKKGIGFLPSCVQVRCMSRVNVKHPRPRHLLRRIMEQVVRPIIIEETPKWRTCTEQKSQTEEVNPFEEFLFRRCQRMFEQNKMIIVCQPLPMISEVKKAINNKLMKKGMSLQFYNNKLIRRTITDTKYENMLPWILFKNMYIISPEPRLSEMMLVLRKTPQLKILGGLVEDRLLSHHDIMTMARLPNLDMMRGQIVATLNSAVSRTNSLLSSNQQLLSTNLQQYIKHSQEIDDS